MAEGQASKVKRRLQAEIAATGKMSKLLQPKVNQSHYKRSIPWSMQALGKAVR